MDAMCFNSVGRRNGATPAVFLYWNYNCDFISAAGVLIPENLRTANLNLKTAALPSFPD